MNQEDKMTTLLERNQEFANLYAPEAIRTVRAALPRLIAQDPDLVEIRVASYEADTQEATDLELEVVGLHRWPVRVRRPDCRYRDLTIRYWRPSGARTEWAKLHDGNPRFYLYAWTDYTSGDRFSEWMIVDMPRFLAHPIADQGIVRYNTDGSQFLAWSRDSLRAAGLLLEPHAPLSLF